MTKTKLISFSPGGEKLAHSGPDGILRIWDTTSGVLEHEYQPAEHLKATTSCIKYSPKAGKKQSGHCLLAMGTLAGTVLLYSPEESEVKATLEHSTHQAVMDVAWFSSDRLVSLARDNTIVIWEIETGKKEVLNEVCEGTAICVFGKKTIILGNRGISVIMQLNSGKVKVKKNFTGHVSAVTQLLRVKVGEETGGNYFLSSSIDDRFIYAWSTESPGDSPICSFMVKDTVTNMSVGNIGNNTVALAATTHKGAMVLFKHHLNGSSSHAVKKTGSLQIYSTSNNKKTVIPIVASYICKDSSSSVIFVYSKSSIFTFERMPIGEIVGDMELVRTEASPSKGVSLMKTLTPTVTEKAVIVGPLHPSASEPVKTKRKRGDDDNVASLPMEERLNVLALDKSEGQAASRRLGADDFAQLLLQGLHSKDQNILRSVFDRGDVKAINKTVRRLPVQAIVPLMEQLSLAIMGKGHKDANQVKWVRAVLNNHMSHLTTVPDRMELMEPFFNICRSRMSTFSQVTQLHARLDLMLTHVATRKEEVNQRDAEPEALLVYRDESSDEDDLMDTMIGGISESEDNWDELSDIDQINGPTDEESDMEVDQKLVAIKRKLGHQDVNGEISDGNAEEVENDNDDDSDDDDGEDDDDDDDDDDEANEDMNGDDIGDTDSESGE